MGDSIIAFYIIQEIYLQQTFRFLEIKPKESYNLTTNLFIFFSVSASFVPGTESNTGRQRHAPLYGRLVPEEHLPATHRDVVHQVNIFSNKINIFMLNV